MKFKTDLALLCSLSFVLLSIVLLFAVAARLQRIFALNQCSQTASEIGSALSCQLETARSLRGFSPTREQARASSLQLRDHLAEQFELLKQSCPPKDQQMQSFILLLQKDWSQVESYMQDLRAGFETSWQKSSSIVEAMREKIVQRNQLNRIEAQASLKQLYLLLSLWLLAAVALTGFLLWQKYRQEQEQRRVLTNYLALSRDFGGSGSEMTRGGEAAESLSEAPLADSLEKSLAFCFERFQQESQSKDSFFASMSHEIRTPLNGLVGFLGNLAETPLNDQQRQYLRIIDSSARSLMHVINQILDYSKIQAGKMSLEDVAFDLHAFIEERVAIAKQLARGKSVKVLLQYEGEKPQIIRADAGRLRQVLDNLLNNAVKFTERGEVVLELLCRPEAEDPCNLKLDFAVRDSGVGIPFNIQQRLFKPFAQADDSVARRYGGSGLGLSISSSLVKLMGGQMQLQSRPGEGSSFSFSLSVLAAKPEEQVYMSELYKVILPRTELKKYWALLVDDTPTNLFLLETICQSVGLPYRTAQNGREALELCRQQRFDLIFMDIQMPIMDGYTAIREIRKLDNSGRTHIIALTASAFQEDIDQALGAGSTGFIPKPFERDQLLLCIAEALGLVPERQFREAQLPQESSEGAIVRQMHDFMREQYQISLGEIKMILAQTVMDWRPVLDNLNTYAQQGNAEETIAILQRLKGQLVSRGLIEHSEQSVQIMAAFRGKDRAAAQILVSNFCHALSRIFKALEQEVTVT